MIFNFFNFVLHIISNLSLRKIFPSYFSFPFHQKYMFILVSKSPFFTYYLCYKENPEDTYSILWTVILLSLWKYPYLMHLRLFTFSCSCLSFSCTRKSSSFFWFSPLFLSLHFLAFLFAFEWRIYCIFDPPHLKEHRHQF